MIRAITGWIRNSRKALVKIEKAWSTMSEVLLRSHGGAVFRH
jgi:hypothetical protein